MPRKPLWIRRTLSKAMPLPVMGTTEGAVSRAGVPGASECIGDEISGGAYPVVDKPCVSSDDKIDQ